MMKVRRIATRTRWRSREDSQTRFISRSAEKIYPENRLICAVVVSPLFSGQPAGLKSPSQFLHRVSLHDMTHLYNIIFVFALLNLRISFANLSQDFKWNRGGSYEDLVIISNQRKSENSDLLLWLPDHRLSISFNFYWSLKHRNVSRKISLQWPVVFLIKRNVARGTWIWIGITLFSHSVSSQFSNHESATH